MVRFTLCEPVSALTLCLGSFFSSCTHFRFVALVLFILLRSFFFFHFYVYFYVNTVTVGDCVAVRAYARMHGVWRWLWCSVRMKLLYVKRSLSKWKQLSSGKYDMQNTKWNMFGLSSLLWPRPERPATFLSIISRFFDQFYPKVFRRKVFACNLQWLRALSKYVARDTKRMVGKVLRIWFAGI